MAVFRRVMLAGFFSVMHRVQTVAVSDVGVVSRLFMVAGLVVPGCLAVVLGRILMMLCRRIVMIDTFVVLGHALLLLVVDVEGHPCGECLDRV